MLHKSRLITIPCKRCEKKLYSLRDSLGITSEELKTKYQGICKGCLTDEEEKEFERSLDGDIKRYCARHSAS